MIELSPEHISRLIKEAKRAYPNEACGILAGGKDQRIEAVYPLTNIEPSSATYFADPKEQVQVMKQLREEGREIVGIYHSHPDGEAYPSERDVELALWPDSFYLIISLKDMDEPVIKAFRIRKGKIKEEEITST